MSSPSIVKARTASPAILSAVLSAVLAIVALSASGCSLTSRKPEAPTNKVASGPRPTSALEAMQQATGDARRERADNGTTAYVDPLVSARPGEAGGATTVRDFRASGRSALSAMRNGSASAEPALLVSTGAGRARAITGQVETMTPRAVAAQTAMAQTEMSQASMAGVVTQPTGIQAGRNSIFSAGAVPTAENTAEPAARSAAASATHAAASLSADAVADAPVRRISGTTGGLFAGGPQMAAASNGIGATGTAGPTTPTIATSPAASVAEPVVQGLW
ncbi:hypothetical protein ACQKKX_09260 [Neorhizobium sp. NPDC001467]|uniref:hypothetical protein n=1 Tax=Neorhizobium sp. NPDC001467 TaxID=3390595 RepID=UPI003CFCFEA4